MSLIYDVAISILGSIVLTIITVRIFQRVVNLPALNAEQDGRQNVGQLPIDAVVPNRYEHHDD